MCDARRCDPCRPPDWPSPQHRERALGQEARRRPRKRSSGVWASSVDSSRIRRQCSRGCIAGFARRTTKTVCSRWRSCLFSTASARGTGSISSRPPCTPGCSCFRASAVAPRVAPALRSPLAADVRLSTTRPSRRGLTVASATRHVIEPWRSHRIFQRGSRWPGAARAGSAPAAVRDAPGRLSDESELSWGGYRLDQFVSTTTLEVRGCSGTATAGPGSARPGGEPGAWPRRRRTPSGRSASGPETKVPVTVVLRSEDPRASLATGQLRGRLEVYAADQTSTVPWTDSRSRSSRARPQPSPTSSISSPALRARDRRFLRGGTFARELPSDRTQDGLFMLHPYRARPKIPVVLVHGTASSPDALG